jgi:CRP-like cAMP-binding protein
MLPVFPVPKANRPTALSFAECPLKGPPMDRTSEKTGNFLLDALDPTVRTSLLADAEHQSIEVWGEYVTPGEDVRSVFFPTSGTLSLLAEPDEETIVEAATIGREGAGDVFVALGALQAAHRMIGQIEGEMFVVDADAISECISRDQRTKTLIFSYVQAQYSQTALSAACNAKHHVNQRAARWLLQSHDRVEGDTFFLKQEFLAFMLGVTRPSVSLAAETLQAAGLIGYVRGTITVRDREGLEGVACACYEQIRSVYSHLVHL